MDAAQVARWLATHPLSPAHVDCATAVMLKILDGKCKMRPTEKTLMALLYDQVRARPGALRRVQAESIGDRVPQGQDAEEPRRAARQGLFVAHPQRVGDHARAGGFPVEAGHELVGQARDLRGAVDQPEPAAARRQGRRGASDRWPGCASRG